jgi:hypothetical protein
LVDKISNSIFALPNEGYIEKRCKLPKNVVEKVFKNNLKINTKTFGGVNYMVVSLRLLREKG